VLINHFAEVNEYEVGTLLHQYGPELADERILPALQTLATSTGIFTGNKTAALDEIHRIILDSHMEDYVAREACSDSPIQIRDLLRLTDVETILSVDACLGPRLEAALSASPGGRNKLALENTLAYAARFADSALVPAVEKVYSTRMDETRWTQTAHGAAVCYLTRWNASHAKELLEAVLLEGTNKTSSSCSELRKSQCRPTCSYGLFCATGSLER
jgi:hypothetical protein